VDAPSPFTSSEAAFLRALLEEGVEFLVVGAAAAALQGAPAVTQDIDLWFEDLSDPRLARALRRVGAAYVAPTLQNPPLVVGGGADLFDIVVHMHGLGPFRSEARRAARVRLGDLEIPVLPLARILLSKKAAGRPKDLAMLPALEDALRVLEARRRKGRGRSPRGKKTPG
jgi:hypothetical protein